jgi:heat shock protein HslJ
MTSLGLAAGLLLVAVLGVVPGSAARAQDASPTVTAQPIASAVPLDVRPEGTWVATAYDTWGEGPVAPLRGSTLTVSLLPAGRLEGQTGCGSFLGGSSVDGQALRLGIISFGSGSCRQRLDDEAFGFTQALAAVTGWAPGPTGLRLLDDEGRVRVSLERPQEVGPSGAWLVERLARTDGELGPILRRTEVSLVLADDGSFTGDTGCRQLEGSYTVEADRIVIAPIVVVGLPCDGPDLRPLQRQDRRLLALLDQAVAWGRAGETLTLADGAGSAILELRALPSGGLPEASPAPVGAVATALPLAEGETPSPSPSAG